MTQTPKIGPRKIGPRKIGPRKILRSALIVGVLGIAPLALTACEEKGSAEKAGEAVDDAARDAKKALEDATK